MYSRLASRIRSSDYLAKIGWLVRGNLIAQIIQICALPILTRLYVPEEFGAFALYVAFSAFASVALTLRLESAIPIADDEDFPRLVPLATRCVLAVSILSIPVLTCLIWFDLLGYGILPLWVPMLTAFALTGIGFFNIGRAVCLREGKADKLAASRIERSVANALAKIGLAFLLPGGAGLFCGEAISAWASLRKVGSALLLRSALLRQKLDSSIRSVWGRFRKFTYYELPSSILDQAALILPLPMVASIGGASAAGGYLVARMVVILPNAQIGRAVGDGFQLRVAQLAREGQVGRVLATIAKTTLGLALSGLIPYAAIAIVSPWAFPFLLGEEWHLSGEIASLLAIWMYFAFIVAPVSRVLSVLQRQEVKLIYDVFVFVATCVLYAHVLHSKLGAMDFVAGLVVLNAIGYTLYLVLIVLISCKILQRGKSHDSVSS